jgi:hypothetical protein
MNDRVPGLRVFRRRPQDPVIHWYDVAVRDGLPA